MESPKDKEGDPVNDKPKAAIGGEDSESTCNSGEGGGGGDSSSGGAGKKQSKTPQKKSTITKLGYREQKEQRRLEANRVRARERRKREKVRVCFFFEMQALSTNLLHVVHVQMYPIRLRVASTCVMYASQLPWCLLFRCILKYYMYMSLLLCLSRSRRTRCSKRCSS